MPSSKPSSGLIFTSGIVTSRIASACVLHPFEALSFSRVFYIYPMSRITSDEAHGFSPTLLCNNRNGCSSGAPLAINIAELTADAKFQTLSRRDVHLWNRHFKDCIGLRWDRCGSCLPTLLCNNRNRCSSGAPLPINIAELTADAKFQTLSRPDVHLWNRNFKDRIGLRVTPL